MGRVLTSRNYSVPDLDEPANIPKDLLTLAAAVDAEIAFIDSGWLPLPAFENGWTAVSGYPLQLLRLGRIRYIRGMGKPASVAGATLNITTLLVEDRPSSNTWIGTQLQAGGASLSLNVTALGGVTFIAGYTSGAVTAGIVPICGWWVAG